MTERRCFAAPMCNVMAELSILRWGEGPDGVVAVFPVHRRNNDTDQGECPGSGARVMVTGQLHRGDDLRIRLAGAEWVRQQAAAARRGESELDDEVAELLRGVLQEGGAHLGRPVDQPRDNYFPGRPADAPEPGVGERPAGRPAMDLGGGFLGRAAVDNARDQLRTLVQMAIDQMGQAQDTLAKMTSAVDSIVAHAAAVQENLQAATALVHAAIGAHGDLPEAAQFLREQLAAASESVRTSNDGITMALRVRIEQAYSQIGTGIDAAVTYRAQP